MRKNLQTTIKIAISIVVLIPICIWIAALLKCEILTVMHGNEFKTMYIETNMISDIDYLKVLQYSDMTAEIYYVTANKGSGELIWVYKENDEWRFIEWYTVWSDSGSASGVIWPYWWHFIYGGL